MHLLLKNNVIIQSAAMHLAMKQAFPILDKRVALYVPIKN